MASYSRCSLLGRQPGLDRRDRDGLAARRRRRTFVLADRHRLVGALRGRQHGVDGGMGAGAVRLERVEGAGGGEAFQHALVDRARIDAAGEVGEIGERLVAARRDDASRPPDGRRL